MGNPLPLLSPVISVADALDGFDLVNGVYGINVQSVHKVASSKSFSENKNVQCKKFLKKLESAKIYKEKIRIIGD